MSVFVDTSALFAVLDRDDPNHAAATGAFERLGAVEELVTHNYVHLESDQLVRRRLGSDAAATLIDRLLPALTTIWVDEPVHAEALAAIRSAGRAASLVDQVSFILMRREGIMEALAYDADFDAEGFRAPSLAGRPPDHRLSEAVSRYGSDPRDEMDPVLVGITEIAARSGHSANTVQSWRRRHRTFPEPAASLASGPVWEWSSVAAWIDAGR
jgi:predicted nucleic acid-binding protein